MFDALKGKIATFETRVTGVLGKLRGGVLELRAEVDGIDKALLSPIDKLKAVVVKTRGGVTQELQKVRREIEELEPPR